MWNLALGSQAKAHAIKATPLPATCPSHLHAPAELLHLHAPAICFSGGSRLPVARLKPPKRFRRPPRQQLLQLHAPAICFSGSSRLPFDRPETLQTLPQASKATTLTATCPCHLFFRSSRLPFDRPETLQTLPQASKATILTATCPCHLFFREFKPAVCQPAKPPKCFPAAPMPFASSGIVLLWWVVSSLNPPNASLQLPCRLPAPALSFYGGSSLPFASPQNPPNGSLQLPCRLQPRHCPFMVVQACRLPARKTPKCFPAAPMPFASPGIVLLWWFKPAVCQPAKPPKCFPAAPMPFASPGIVLLWWFRGWQTAWELQGSIWGFCGRANGRLEPP